jgi:phage-related holin
MIMKVLLKFLAFIIIALQPIYNVLMAMFIFMIIDMITGTWKAIKFKEFKPSKFANSIGKFILYMTAIVLCQIADIYFELPKIATACTSVIVVVEVTSILENITKITGLNVLRKVIDIFKRQDA